MEAQLALFDLPARNVTPCPGGEKLPDSLQALLEIGIPGLAVLALMRQFGGTRIWIPAVVNENHPLAEIMGLGPARQLAAFAARTWLDVPRGHAALLAARNMAMRRAYDAGASANGLARAYQMTRRQVTTILNSG